MRSLLAVSKRLIVAPLMALLIAGTYMSVPANGETPESQTAQPTNSTPTTSSATTTATTTTSTTSTGTTTTGTTSVPPTTASTNGGGSAGSTSGEPTTGTLVAPTEIGIPAVEGIPVFGYEFFREARQLADARLGIKRIQYLPVVVDPTQAKTTVTPGGAIPGTGTTGSIGSDPKTTGTTGSTATTGTNGTTATNGATTATTGATGTTGNGTTGANATTGTNGSTVVTGTNGSNNNALQQPIGPGQMLRGNVVLPVPDRYQLGPGDKLEVRTTSPVLATQTAEVTIDMQGTIIVPGTNARVVLRGLTLAQAQRVLTREARQYIRDANVEINLSELRTITIRILGEAYSPGTYEVPSIITFFNALYAAGGPSDIGSFRNITLRRINGQTRRMDLYKFLVEGDASQDVPLQPGDTILIPPSESKVIVKGEVRRVAVYELREGETLRDAIKFSGGAKPSGVTQRVSVDSVTPGVSRKLIDANLLGAGNDNNPRLYDGDVVEVFSIRPTIVNQVTIEGAVDQPRAYGLREGMRVADLLDYARGLLPSAATERADLFRLNPDGTSTLIPIDLKAAIEKNLAANIELQPNDRLVVYNIADVRFIGTRRVKVEGAVQRPSELVRADGMTVRDALIQVGGLMPNANDELGFLQKQNPDGSPGELIRLNLRQTVSGVPEQNPALGDGDRILILTKQESAYAGDQSVRILGAVQRPGPYPSSTGLRLRDLVALAGGVLPNAADFFEISSAWQETNTPVRRVSLAELATGGPGADTELKAGDTVTISYQTEKIDKPRVVTIMGAVRFAGPYMLNTRNDKISSIIARAGGLTDRAYPAGTEFVRDPRYLVSEKVKNLAPEIVDTLKLIQEDEYKRASALVDMDRLRIVFTNGASLNGGASGTPFLGGSQSSGAQIRPGETFDQALARTFSSEAVTRARTLTERDLIPNGNLAINLDGALKRPNSRDDIPLEDGDVIFIPETPTSVNIMGAVTVPTSVLFERGKNVQYYLDRAGGTTVDAAEDGILIVRASGAIVRYRRGVRVELGDTILVPTKTMAVRLRERNDFITASNVLGSAALSIALIRNLTR